MSTPRMRTITEAITAIRSEDEHTAFTASALRRMVRSGEMPSVRVGNKYLVNLDTLMECLSKPASMASIPREGAEIRPIPERMR